jgi:hypothetical protein
MNSAYLGCFSRRVGEPVHGPAASHRPCSLWLAVVAIVCAPPLAQSQDAFPDSPARDTVVVICSQCHPLTRILDSNMRKAEWEALLYDMISRGATVYDRELTVVLDYLAENFATDER